MSRREETDPVKLGLAAGSSSDPFNLGLSDKGAQEFAKGTESIETTSKMGGWQMIIDMCMKILDVSNNPMLKVFMQFFEMFGKFLNAEAAEAAAALAKYLFREENIKTMKQIAEGFGVLFDALGDLITWLDKSEQMVYKFTGTASRLELILHTVNHVFEQYVSLNESIGSIYIELNSSIGHFLSKLEDFKDIIEDIADAIEDVVG